eukprot:CAMPEP_0173470002 /NCGR_PEP_ID=MMETSP1357-20121228/77655_1 /TAXON_ID=77926 /ORGANISM="Hemiselmis rufescens, Strain PCC563" /LENGTH=242 /DNA_ID=CAMNT_0014438263 /DNA_START=110 /DNA_END=840 /DNA_ORIENTATION=-
MNGMEFQRAGSFAPPKKDKETPQLLRSQSLNMSMGIQMSVDSLYNHAVRYHKVEKNNELAEASFRAAISRKEDHIPSLVGLGSLLKELGRQDEADEYLHKATGLIMCPATLPGEAKIRRIAEARSNSSKTLLPPKKEVPGGEAHKSSPLNSAPKPPPAPIRMGSMKAILAMNDVMGDVTNKKQALSAVNQGASSAEAAMLLGGGAPMDAGVGRPLGTGGAAWRLGPGPEAQDGGGAGQAGCT